MSSPPSGDSDERGPETSPDAPDSASERRSDSRAVPTRLASPLDSGPVTGTRARVLDPNSDVAFYEAEAAAAQPTASKRAAPLVHEGAALRERTPGLEREAARAYAHSLTVDPSFAPNSWALRRIFVRRGLWDNLVRVLDAEIRFSSWPRHGDRADLQLERGRILEDRLSRDAEGLEGYRAALETSPDHPGALWSLLLHAWRTADASGAEQALTALLRRTAEPGARALLALELARLQRRGARVEPDGEALGRAADTLLRALSTGAAAGPLLRELDRLSLLSDKVDLRLRFLDAFESRVIREVVQQSHNGHVASDPALAAIVGNHREKARILLRRGARDAALAVLERTLRVAPAHPLVVMDFLDAAEEAGRPDAIVEMLEGPLSQLPAEAQAEALLRRAEIAEKAGALGEAIGALDRIPEASVFSSLALLARLRVLARLQDAEGLSRAFADAARVLADGGERDRHEAAHLFVRAATAGQRASEGDGGGTVEEHLRRALLLVPGYGPAATALAAVLARGSRFSDLATFVESQAAPGGALPRPLHEALVILYRDILGDGAEALRHQGALLAGDDDFRSHARAADVAGLALAGPAPSPEAVEAARTSLAWLADKAPAGSLRATFRLLAARLARDPAASEALARQAFEEDPGSPASGILGALGDPEQRLAQLGLELRAAEQGGRLNSARALRYRLAFAAASAGRTVEAVEQLAPLRQSGDRLAVAWSLDLARQAGDARTEASLLGEQGRRPQLGEDDTDAFGDTGSAYERARALGEALEQLGNRSAAAEAYREAARHAGDVADPDRAVDVELGLLRSHVAEGHIGETVASLRRLGDLLPGDAGAAVRREAGLLAVSAGLPSEDAPGEGSADGVWRWLRGARSGDPAELVRGLDQLARHAAETPGTSALWTAIGARQAFLGDQDAPVTLERAARALNNGPGDAEQAELTAALAVATTDLVGPAGLPPSLAELRRSRATRLSRGGDAERRVAEALLLEEAFDAESSGRLSDAATSYGEVLALAPTSLEATEGLRRIAQATGDRRSQAAALIRRGTLSRARRRSAEAFAEAALLLQEQGADGEAARLFLEVLSRTPDDEEAYRRLHDILTRRQDQGGLERLLSYKLQQTTDPALRVRLYLERARLRLGRQDVKSAVEDFRRVLQIAPQDAEALRTLGELALDEGRFAVAASFLERALAEPHADSEVMANLRLQLAEAQEASGDLASSIRTLTAAAEARPEDPEPSERLVALAIRRRDHALALAHLSALESRATDPAVRAGALVRIGRIERDGRQDPNRAVAAFRTALVIDPLGEAATELASLALTGINLEDGDRNAIDGVISELRRSLLEADPLDARRLERLRDLARLRGLWDLAEVSGQLLGALGVAVPRGRARDLHRPLTLAGLASLLAGSEGPAPSLLFEMWPHIGEGAARLEGLDAAQFGASRHTRILPGSEPRLAWLEAAALSLGIGPMSVHVAGADDLAVLAIDTPEPTLLVGRGILGGDPPSRFRVGRALFLLRQRAASVERVSPPDLADTVRAAALLAGAHPPGVDPNIIKSRTKALGKALGRRELRTLEALRPRFDAEPLDILAFRTAMLHGADRFGLLVAGDLAACLRAQTGGESRAALLRRPECIDLIRFALEDRYAALRREVGLPASER
jgi:tetratricopeptide (TPR) repeat protein